MAAPEGLQIGSVRERDLDLDEHVALRGLGLLHLLQAQVARPVEAERPHPLRRSPVPIRPPRPALTSTAGSPRSASGPVRSARENPAGSSTPAGCRSRPTVRS